MTSSLGYLNKLTLIEIQPVSQPEMLTANSVADMYPTSQLFPHLKCKWLSAQGKN